MANRNESSIDGVLNTIVAPKLTQQINRSCVLAQLLPSKAGDGKNITFGVQVGSQTGNAAARAEDADISTYSVDTKVPAVLQYAHLSDAATVSQFAMDAAARSGPEQIGALFMNEFNDTAQRIAKLANQEIISGTGAANHGWGLRSSGSVQAVSDSGIYATLDPATYTDWAGTVVTADAGAGARDALSFTYMRTLRRGIVNKCGERPDLYIVNPLQFDYYGALFDSIRKIEQTTEFVLGGRKIQLDGGYSALFFDGAAVVWDSDVAVDEVVALNTRYVDIEFMPASADPMGNRSGQVMLGGTPTDTSSSMTGIPARIKKLAESGEYTRFGIFTHFQVVVRRRNAVGVLKNLKNS